MNINEAKEQLNGSTKKKTNAKASSSGIGWEIGAYTVRGVSVALPAIVIMCLENSWIKNGIGLLATLLIIALLIIFKEPLKAASSYAPGVVPFTIFIVIAIFFNTTSQSLMTIGISGLSGSVAAIPLHAKYLATKKQEESPELQALKDIAEKLK